MHVRADFQIFAHGEIRKNRATFRHERDPRPRRIFDRELRRIFIFIRERSFDERQQARDRFQRRRFARAVRTDERDDLSPIHVQRNSFERLDGAVANTRIFHFEQMTRSQIGLFSRGMVKLHEAFPNTSR
jgi:hypothetical protein